MRSLRHNPLALGAIGLLVTVGMATGLAAVGTSTEPGSTYGYLKLFNEVLALVRHNYVESVPEDALMKGAYEGLLAALDGESEYLTSAEYRRLTASSADSPATSGIFLTRRSGFLFVASVIPGSDAEAKGVHPGDRVRAIGMAAARDLSFSEAQRMLEGSAGSTVRISLARGEEPGELDVTVEKRVIDLPRPSLETGDDGIAVVRIPSFRKGTADEVAKIFKKLHASATPRAILDLRGNAWGDPGEAIRTAALLAGQGTQAILRKRGGEQEPIEGRMERTPWRGEMLLLTNAGTALSAEIVVAALSDARVATHAGEKTLGRGGEREPITLANGDVLLLTVRKYVSPSGHAWHGTGLDPSVPIPQDPDIPFEQRGERQLDRARSWFTESKEEPKAA